MSKDFPEDFPNTTRLQALPHYYWSIINHFPSLWRNVFSSQGSGKFIVKNKQQLYSN